MFRAVSFLDWRGAARWRRGASRSVAIALFVRSKRNYAVLGFRQRRTRDLGQQVYTIRMHNAQAAHVNCPLRPPHEVHLHQIGVIKFTYPGGACELSDSSFRFPSSSPSPHRCSWLPLLHQSLRDRTHQLKYSQAAISAINYVCMQILIRDFRLQV